MLAGGVNGVLSPNCDSVERTAGTDGFKERFSSMCHTGVERKTHMFSKKYAGLSKVERPAVGLLLSDTIVLLGWKAAESRWGMSGAAGPSDTWAELVLTWGPHCWPFEDEWALQRADRPQCTDMLRGAVWKSGCTASCC